MANIIIIGDSITYAKGINGGGYASRLKQSFEENNNNTYVHYNGFSGETTTKLLERFDNLCKGLYYPGTDTVIIIQIGINDTQNNKIGINTSPVTFKKNIEALSSIAKKYSSKVLFIGLTRVSQENDETPFKWKSSKYYYNKIIEKYDKLLKNICKKEGCDYLEIASLINTKDLADGLHPNEEGHQKLCDAVFTKIQEINRRPINRVSQRFNEWLDEFPFFSNQKHEDHERAESKRQHVYNTKKLSEELARLKGLSDNEIQLAGICGLLHDCGRFLELKKYKDFNDQKNNFDHAKEGAQILRMGLLKQLYPEATKEEEKLIIKVAEYHQMSSIPEELSEKEAMFLDIIKAADSLDLFERACTIPDELNMDQPLGEKRRIHPCIKYLFARGKRIDLKKIGEKIKIFEKDYQFTKIDFSTLRLGLISIIFNNLKVLDLIEKKDYISRICNYLRNLNYYKKEEIDWLERTAKRQFEEKKRMLLEKEEKESGR